MNVFEDEFGSLDFEDLDCCSFHNFANLPVEIRLKIWHLAAPRSAIIERSWNNDNFAFGLRRKVPVVLQVCRESRNEHLAWLADEGEDGNHDWRYNLWRIGHDGRQAPPEGGVFVNWKRDTVWIYRGNLTSSELGTYKYVQNLAMEWGLRPCWLQESCDKGVELIKKFPNLKVLTLLVHFCIWTDDDLSKRHISCAERKVTRELKGWVEEAMNAASEKDSTWKAPEVRVVPKTKYWESSDSGKA